MSEIGITSYAAYVPWLRMDRQAIAKAHAWALPALRGLGKGERAFTSWDEDAITMGVEAVRDCLAAGPGSNSVESLLFASTTAPFADLQNSTIVARAAGLPDSIASLDTGGSLRAGVAGLIQALRAQASGDTIVVASDNRRAKPGSVQEMHYGAGAVALQVGGDGNAVARFVGSASSSSEFVDHFRANGEKFDYYWEERWVRDEGYLKIVPRTVGRLLEDLAIDATSIDYFCMPATIRGVAKAVARRVGLPPESVVDNLAAECGDTGIAHPLMMLAHALDQAQPGQRVLLVGFGTGCDAVLLETTEAIADYRPKASVAASLANKSVETSYNKFLSFADEIDIDWGMRAETDAKTALTQLYRSADQVISFTGGQCRSCDAIQFPVLAACVKCGATEPLSRYKLADESAKVATYTADWLMYYPSPPLYVGLVQFDNGARVLMEMVDVQQDQFDVGTPLRMVFRIKEKDNMRHFNRYFWKATPVR